MRTCAALAGAVVAAVAFSGSANGSTLVGRGDDGPDRPRLASFWHLEGRELTIRFRRRDLGRSRARVYVACGDDVSSGGPRFFDPGFGPVWARSVHAWVRVRGGQSQLHVQFSHDISRWTNRCKLEGRAGRLPVSAPLRAVRGPQAGCALAGRERLLRRTAAAQLTTLTNYHPGPFNQEGGNAYRACLRGAPQPIPIAAEGPGFGSSGSDLGPFALGGSWVAWSILDFGPGAEAPEPINLLDLRRPTRPVSIAPEVPPGRQGDEVVKELAVSREGAVAWTLWIIDPFPRYQLLLHTPVGSERVLAENNRPTLFKPRFTLDAAAISWTSHGRPASATVGP